MNEIKVLVMDVDGTLTDGKIYMGADGEMFKAFSIKDGYGINDILHPKEIIPVIITGRKSKIVEKRCKELHIKYLYQGVQDKLRILNELLDELSKAKNEMITLRNVAYIGDDCNDLECMKAIRSNGGIVGCPANAVKKVIQISHFVSECNGGDGAVRDFIDYLNE